MKWKRTQQTVRAADGFYNALSGLGAPGSREDAIRFAVGYDLSDQMCEQLYTHNWVARRICEVFPEQALRRAWSGAPDEVQKEFKRLNYADPTRKEGLFAGAAVESNVYGTSALLIGLRGSGTRLPTTPATIGRGTVAWLDVVPKPQIQILSRFTDANLPTFGQPEVIRIIGQHPRRNQEFHTSRVVWFQGAPTIGDRKASKENFWGDSLLQNVYIDIGRYALAWTALGRMLEELDIPVFKMKGLVEALGSMNDELLRARMKLMSVGKAVGRTIFLDADSEEEYSRVRVALDDLPETLEQVALNLSGATYIPFSVLFGREAEGMNATGDGTRTQYYDRLEAYRQNEMQPALERVLSFIAGSEITIEFPPLFQPSEREEAQIRLLVAQADKVYLDARGVTGPELVKRRVADESFGIVVTPAPELPAGAAPGAGGEMSDTPPVQTTGTELTSPSSTVASVDEIVADIQAGRDPVFIKEEK